MLLRPSPTSKTHTQPNQQGQLRELQESLAAAERRVFESELVRRKLHNAIQELKGSVRVICRVRPPRAAAGAAAEAVAGAGAAEGAAAAAAGGEPVAASFPTSGAPLGEGAFRMRGGAFGWMLSHAGLKCWL